MKKLTLICMLVSLLLSGCKKDEKIDYFSLIAGRWVNTLVDNQPILTDASFTFEFRSDHEQSYATGFILDENNKTWIDNANYTYSVSDNKIIIDGSNQQGNVFHMEFAIIYVDGQTLRYSVSKFMIDNVAYPDPKTYTHQKVTSYLRNQFIGTWYGKSTTPGTADTSYHYWSYFSEGNYNYYYRDNLGKWINKPDNEGKYFLYGNFLASNYTNDLLSGGTGKAFECWNISIKGDTMLWSGLRTFGQTTSYKMGKVAGPPVFN